MARDVPVTVADIARLGDVGRAAVSNWRRRHDDFPQPIGGTSTSPVFSLNEVRRWLLAQGRPLPSREWLWQDLRAAASEDELTDLIADVGAFLVYLARDRADWAELSTNDDAAMATELPQRVRTAIATLIADPPPLRSLTRPRIPLLRRLAALATEHGPAETFHFLRERYFEVHARRTYPTPEPVARLMAELGGLSAGKVFDPACGSGALLEPFCDRPGSGPALLLGQDSDEAAARLTAVYLAFRADRVHIARGDSLRHDAFPGTLADVVVCNPPFNDRGWGHEELSADPRWEYGLPPRTESELAWVQHALSHLGTGGTAVLLMPPAAADRRSGRRIRAQLIRRGAFRAAITLPLGAVPNTAVALVLWVLRKPADVRTPSHVLMVDTSNRPEDFADVAAGAWARFDRGEEADEPGVSRAVPVVDLLDEEVDLTPARYLSSPVQELVPEQVARERDRLADLLRMTAELVSTVETASGPRDLPMVPLSELVRRGMVTIHQQSTAKPDGESAPVTGNTPVLTAEDVLLDRPPSGIASDIPVQHEIVVESGDVIVSLAATTPIARVADKGDAVLGPRLTLLRPDPGSLDPAFLAGFVNSSANARHLTGTSSRSQVDVRRVKIPLLPVEEQRAYAETFRRLADFGARLRRATVLGEDLIRLVTDGLTHGSVRPIATDPKGTR